MFLTEEQMIELTGFRRWSLQIKQLRKHGVKHYVRRDGRPVVCVVDLSPASQLAGPAPARPDFAAVRRSA